MSLFRKKAIFVATGLAALIMPYSQAGTFTANFNDGNTPAGSTLNGTTGGGTIDAGVLKLTKSVNGQTGSLVIDDLDAGAPVYGFDFAAKVRVGGGSNPPADGFSLTFDPTLTQNSVPGEDGTGQGITFTFDIFDNGGGEGPSIDVRVGGQVVATKKYTVADIRTGADFLDVHGTVAADGAVTLVYKGVTVFDHVYFPGYQPITAGLFALSARTGGLNENIWFDDITITTFTTPQVGIVSSPASQTVVNGANVTLAPVLNNVEGATYQWIRNGQNVAGATDATYSFTASNADNNAKYQLKVTGSNNTVTTPETTLTVVDIPLPTATASFDFNTTDAPAGTTLFGNGVGGGYITADGGVDGSGVLHLTDAINGATGGIVIDDLANGAPVTGITASFKLRLGGGSNPPADGFSFNFANDLPADPSAAIFEEGVGTGFSVNFDVYDSGGGEAPAIDARIGGQVVATSKLPLSFLDTADGYADVIIRLQNDGTLDVAYKGVVIFNNITVPNFTSLTGGKVLIGGRTGGLNANMWVDDLKLTIDTTVGDLRITTNPTDRYVVAGTEITLSSVANQTEGVTFQWKRNGENVTGATGATYTFTPTAADSGASYTVTVTKGALNATSTAAIVTVLPITPTFGYDFNDGVAPAGATVLSNTQNGGGFVTATGGVGDTGVFHLTDNVNGQQGALISPAVFGGAEIAAFKVAFDLRLGGGSGNPADGMSFNMAGNLPESFVGDLEEGLGNGLTVTFDIYDNGGGEAPSVDLKWRNATVGQVKLSKADIQTGDAFRTVIVNVTADGKADLVFGDRILFKNIQLPNYVGTSNARFGWYGRTGGENENQWLDNVKIEATKTTAPLRIVNEPADVLLIAGQTATFSTSVSDPNGATYQYFKGATAIDGATSATYTTPALTLADTGATYSVRVTGPGGTATSRTAVATVVAPLTISNPTKVIDFNDGLLPADTTLNGSAGGGYITADGGVNNSGVLHLTDAVNGQGGTFFIRDFNGGTAVGAFTAHFKIRIGGGSDVPADGASFVWANDIDPDNTGLIFGEDGSGTGLVVSFDIYNNQDNEAPAFDIHYGGAEVATLKVPIAKLLTGDNFGDVFIRLQNDGTVDVQYNGNAIFNNVALPGFTPMTGGIFAFGGRTGGLNANQFIDDIEIATSTSMQGPTLSVTRSAGNITITWTGGGKLESTDNIVSNTWTEVVGATSPATIPTTGTMRFFRVKQ